MATSSPDKFREGLDDVLADDRFGHGRSRCPCGPLDGEDREDGYCPAFEPVLLLWLSEGKMRCLSVRNLGFGP
jgi:hypothetical protein